MSIQNVEIKAGELICFSSGEYSDYGYNGHFVGLVNVSHNEMLELVESLKSEERDFDSHGKFIAQCIRNGWLLSVNCREIHIGSYGRLDLL